MKVLVSFSLAEKKKNGFSKKRKNKNTITSIVFHLLHWKERTRDAQCHTSSNPSHVCLSLVVAADYIGIPVHGSREAKQTTKKKKNVFLFFRKETKNETKRQ